MDTDWLPAIAALIMAAIALYQARSQKTQVEATVEKLRAETTKAQADVSTSAVMAAAAIIDDMREEDHRKQSRILELEASCQKQAEEFERTLKKKLAETTNLQSQLMQAHEYISVLESRAETIDEVIEAIRSVAQENNKETF